MTWHANPSSEDHEPRRVGASLDRLLGRLSGNRSGALMGVFHGWDEVVGPQIAVHARPVSLTAGTLVVAVDEPAWATQLRFLADDLIRRLNDAAGEGAVTVLEVRVRP